MKKNPVLFKAILKEIAQAEATLQAIEKLRGPSGEHKPEPGRTLSAYDEIKLDLENLKKDLKTFNTTKPVQELRELHVLRFTRAQLEEKLEKIEEAESKARTRAKRSNIDAKTAIAEDTTIIALRRGELNIRRNIQRLEKYIEEVSRG